MTSSGQSHAPGLDGAAGVFAKAGGTLLLRGGRVVDPAAGLDAVNDILLVGGVIAELGPRLTAPEGAVVIEADGKVVCPGFIDMHVHLREPGFEYKETVASGTRAAAAGGFTAVCCMANTFPVNDNRSITDYILAKAKTEGVVRVYPIGAVTRGLGGEELAELAELAEAGCVGFSDDGKCVMNAGLYRRAMEYTLPFGVPVISHAEDANLSRHTSMNEGVVSTELGIAGAPPAAEDAMVARDVILAELTGAHVHIAHLSTAGAVRIVRDAKTRGVRVTAEAAPHHLVLTEDAVRTWDPNTKMNPPLRTKRDVEILAEALIDGTIDCIATDHAPHAVSEKEGEYDRAAFGVVGLETAVPVLLDRLVRPGVLDLKTLIARLSTDPARLLGLPGGSLSPGQPGDLAVLDLARELAIQPARFHSRGRNTPFAGWTVTGAPWMTIVNGHIVWQAERLDPIASARAADAPVRPRVRKAAP
jgi:dihydroorotase